MDAPTFRTTLLADGFAEILERDFEPGATIPLHSHAWDSRLLVLEGSVTLERDGVRQRFETGQWCEVPREAVHAERYGDEGSRILIGRRH